MRVLLLTSALIIGSWSASPAPAEAKSRWDKVAYCESTGRWHINTGNGYYGGLQISRSTWKAYGGKRYASLPHRASKRQQIAVAERILRGQGRRAWPHCGRHL